MGKSGNSCASARNWLKILRTSQTNADGSRQQPLGGGWLVNGMKMNASAIATTSDLKTENLAYAA